MRWRRQHFWLLLVGLLALVSLGALIFFVPPIVFDIPLIPIFLLLLFFAIFLNASFLFGNTRWGMLAAFFFVMFFLFQAVGLTNPVYAIILFIGIVLFEFSFRREF